MDRWYLRGHSGIDPKTTHTSCPQRALDWDTYMAAIGDVKAAAGHPHMRLWE